jgi:hypothetical protein
MNPTLIKLSVMLVATTLTIDHSSSAAWTKENAELDPLDIFMVNQDNLGMQQKSKQALNVQFTIFQDIVIRKETLYKLNIYGDNRLSENENLLEADLF